MFAFGPGIRHWYSAYPNIPKSQSLGGLSIRAMHSGWILRCWNFAYRPLLSNTTPAFEYRDPTLNIAMHSPSLTRIVFFPVSPELRSTVARSKEQRQRRWVTAARLPSIFPDPLCCALSRQGGWSWKARWLEASGGSGLRPGKNARVICSCALCTYLFLRFSLICVARAALHDCFSPAPHACLVNSHSFHFHG
jgi:hypothetical protein